MDPEDQQPGGDDLMPLDHAYDALSDQVSHFHNDMVRQGTREMTVRGWAREFISWFSEYDFEKDYIATIKLLREFERGAPSPDNTSNPGVSHEPG